MEEHHKESLVSLFDTFYNSRTASNLAALTGLLEARKVCIGEQEVDAQICAIETAVCGFENLQGRWSAALGCSGDGDVDML